MNCYTVRFIVNLIIIMMDIVSDVIVPHSDMLYLAF